MKTIFAFGVPLEIRSAVEAAFPSLALQFPTVRLPLSTLEARIVSTEESCIASWQDTALPREFIDYAHAHKITIAKLAPAGLMIQARSRKESMLPIGYAFHRSDVDEKIIFETLTSAAGLLDKYVHSDHTVVTFGSEKSAFQDEGQLAIVIADDAGGDIALRPDRALAYLSLLKKARSDHPQMRVAFLSNGDVDIEPSDIERIVAAADIVAHQRFSAEVLRSAAQIYTYNSLAAIDARIREVPVASYNLKTQQPDVVGEQALVSSLIEGVGYSNPYNFEKLSFESAIDFVKEEVANLPPPTGTIPIQWRLPKNKNIKTYSKIKGELEPSVYTTEPTQLVVPQVSKLSAPKIVREHTENSIAKSISLPLWIGNPTSEESRDSIAYLEGDFFSLPDGVKPGSLIFTRILVGESQPTEQSIDEFAENQPQTFIRLIRSRLRRICPAAAIFRNSGRLAVKLFARACRQERIRTVFIPLLPFNDRLSSEYSQGAQSLADYIVGWHHSHLKHFKSSPFPANRIKAARCTQNPIAADSLLVCLTESWPDDTSIEKQTISVFLESMVSLTAIYNVSFLLYIHSNALSQINNSTMQLLLESNHSQIEIINSELVPLEWSIKRARYFIGDSSYALLRTGFVPSGIVISGRSVDQNISLSEVYPNLTEFLEKGSTAVPAEQNIGGEDLQICIANCVNDDSYSLNVSLAINYMIERPVVRYVVIPAGERVKQATWLAAFAGASHAEIAYPEMPAPNLAKYDALLVSDRKSNDVAPLVQACQNLSLPIIRISSGPIQIRDTDTPMGISAFLSGMEPVTEMVRNYLEHRQPLDSDERLRAEKLLAQFRNLDHHVLPSMEARPIDAKERKRLVMIDDELTASPDVKTYSYARMVASALRVASDYDIILVCGTADGRKTMTTVRRSIEILNAITNVVVVERPTTIRPLLRSADTVFFVDAAEGYEAFFLGCKIESFSDTSLSMLISQDKDCVLDIVDLFHAYYVRAALYLDPVTAEPCGLESVLDWLELNWERITGSLARESFHERQSATNLETRIARYQETIRTTSLKQASELFLCNFAVWKREFMKAVFKDKKTNFVPNASSVLALDREVQGSRSPAFVIWGRTSAPGVEAISVRRQLPIMRVEDGFVRSVGLGANHILPYSYCIDSRGIYFDATKESDLEHILSTYDFQSDNELMKEAAACRKLLLDADLSKYNFPFPSVPNGPYGDKTRSRILVIGQVEDDASIVYGGPKGITNNDLVRLAYSENTDAEIIYKIHPDVLAGKRGYYSDPLEVATICTISSEPMSIGTALTGVDKVYAITSLAGCEALLRGVPVVAVGLPFYAGWGLTDDRMDNPRRKRQLTIDELFAGAYLLYPSYVNPDTGESMSLREVMRVLIDQLAHISPKGKPWLQ